MTKRKTNKGVAFDGIRRARQTDMVPDHAAPEKDRAGAEPVALSSSVSTQATVKGADLDDII